MENIKTGLSAIGERLTTVRPSYPEPPEGAGKLELAGAIGKQVGRNIGNIPAQILHLPQEAGEASEAWRQGERTPENAGTMLGAAATGLKLGRTPGVVSDPAAVAATRFKEPPAPPQVAEVGRNPEVPPAPPENVGRARPVQKPVEALPPPPDGFEPVPQSAGAARSGLEPEVGPVTKPEVAAVADDLNRLRQSGVADRAEIAQRMEATPPEFKDPALQEKLYNAIENPAEMAKLTPEERLLFDQHIQPMRDELTALYNKVKEYGGEDMVQDPTYVHRIAKGHAPAYDTLSGDAADPITGTRGINKTTSALQGRKMFAIEGEDGRRFVVSESKIPGGKPELWINGKGTPLTTSFPLRPGTQVELGGKTFDIKQATTQEIEANSDVRYHKSAAVNTADALVRMREVARNVEYLEKVKADMVTSGRAVKVNGNRPVPEGFAETKIPQLRGWAFDKKIAAAFDDFYKPGLEGLEGLRKINQFATASLFWQPLPHIENVAWHWYTARGFDWVRPGPMRNFLNDASRAIKETATQGPEYQRLLREGNGVVYGGIKQARFFETLGKQFGMETERQWGAMKPIFDALHIGKPYEAVAWWYDKMRNTLWAANDMFMLHRVFELERKGLSTREAIKEAEKHIPNYRIPSEVLGSRQVSRIMQEPAFLVFMRYHYGQWKSYAHQFTDLVKGSPKDRVEAVGNLMATGFGMLVIIPVLNYILQKLTGDPNAKKLMRGSLSIPDMALQLALGDKTGGESVSNTFTFAPVTKEILQQGYGRDTFTGQNLGGPVPRTEHALKTTIAPYNTLSQATDSNPGSRTAGRLAFDTLAGAKNTSDRSRGMQEYFKKQREKEDERRYQRPTGPLTKGYKAAKDYVSKAYQDYKGP